MKDNDTARRFIELDGASLTLEQLWQIVDSPHVQVRVRKSADAIRKSHEFLLNKARTTVIYGVNTGFGPMATRIVEINKLEELQYNLVRSHASGAGDPLPEPFVLGAMIVRLNTLARGTSGVSLGLIRQLELLINHRIIPVVPEHGSVGTSGDLVQLAHIALVLIGEGHVFYKGKKEKTQKIFKKLGISPYKLKIKEGLALINGTSVMTGIASLLLRDAERIAASSLRLGALSLEVIGAYDDSICETIHAFRPHRGQILSAAILRKYTKGSTRLRKRYEGKTLEPKDGETYAIPRAIQDVYSFRCIPQIVGPLLDTISFAREVLSVEINAATDNPLISVATEEFLHGGNFHGDYIATMVDQLKIPIVKSSLLSERRTNYLLDEKVNGAFSPFLNLNTPGLTLALQGLQFVATSTAAQNQSLAYPHSNHTISTNGSNQDVVSMGTDASLFLKKVIDNTFIVMAIELLSLLQAVDVVGGSTTFSQSNRKFYDAARELSLPVKKDRPLSDDVEKLALFLRNTSDTIILS